MKKEEFNSFLGLTRGDQIGRVEQLFGKPDQVYDNNDNHYIIHYFRFADEDILSVSFNRIDLRIETIFLGCRRLHLTFDWLESLHIDEPKAMLLDKHIDEIIDLLGVPDEEDPDDFFYTTQDLEIDFYCPEENDFFCRRIMVTWFN